LWKETNPVFIMSSGHSSSNTSSSGFIGGLFVGSAIGAIAGLLFAPRPGRETRQLIQKSSEALPELVEDLATTLQLQAGRLSEAAMIQWEATLLRLQEAAQAGIEASQDAHRMATSLPTSTEQPQPTASELPTAAEHESAVPPHL
jgi:gas vesicle protein